jgi:hypothetical protein
MGSRCRRQERSCLSARAGGCTTSIRHRLDSRGAVAGKEVDLDDARGPQADAAIRGIRHPMAAGLLDRHVWR